MLIASVSVISMQFLFSYLPVSQRLFGLESISAGDWLLIVLVTAPVMFVVEIQKFFHRRIIEGNGTNHQIRPA